MSNAPVDWNLRYEQGDTPWDKATCHPELPGWCETLPMDGPVLVPGCGRGRDVLALAERWPQRPIVGVDLAEQAVAAARRLCAGFPRVSFLQADFLARPETLPDAGFDLVWEHTCFCAIPPTLRPAYAATMARVLRPGGILAGVFFLTMDDTRRGPPWNCPEDELRGHFGGKFEIISHGPCRLTFPGREGEEHRVIMRRLG